MTNLLQTSRATTSTIAMITIQITPTAVPITTEFELSPLFGDSEMEEKFILQSLVLKTGPFLDHSKQSISLL